jgi:hypothetical protein
LPLNVYFHPWLKYVARWCPNTTTIDRNSPTL